MLNLFLSHTTFTALLTSLFAGLQFPPSRLLMAHYYAFNFESSVQHEAGERNVSIYKTNKTANHSFK